MDPKVPCPFIVIPSVLHRAYLHNVRTNCPLTDRAKKPLRSRQSTRRRLLERLAMTHLAGLDRVDEKRKRDPPHRVVLAFVTVLDDFPISDETHTFLDHWLQTWNTADLAAQTRIEFSPRLTRSLGRCYPDRRLIRISSHLEGAPDGLLQEVLCHEMAHLATRELHGRNVRPHGPEWKALMTSAGFEPRTRLPSPNGAPRPGRRRRAPLRLPPPLPRLPALPTRAPPH